MENLFRALTIAGSDSGGGAGIQADLKTFQAFDVYGMSVITSITAQNTTGVRSVMDVDKDVIRDQIEVVSEDIGIDACKIGMLSNSEIIETVSETLKKIKISKLVLDPVMVAKSGHFLLKEGDEKHLIEKLLPLTYLVTPNIPEAEHITGIKIGDKAQMYDAAKYIYELGAKNVLLKGGHLTDDNLVDILFDGRDFYTFESQRVHSKNTHGTGCTISAAITALLAKGVSIYDAIDTARNYVIEAIKHAPVNIGKGHGPLYHNVFQHRK